MLGAAGKPFDGLAERKAMFEAIKNTLTNLFVRVKELPYNINDNEFARVAADELLSLL